MRFTVGGMVFGWIWLASLCAPASADGGLLRLSAKSGSYQISVFTLPTPLRAGAVDISMLVQDASTGNPLTDVQVTVRLTQSGKPTLAYPATSATATNKLFHSAQFTLPEPGRWTLEVRVQGSRGPAVVRSELEAAEPLPKWHALWPWIGWPVLVIALFSIHVALEHRNCRTEPAPTLICQECGGQEHQCSKA
jgi:hypothetical protein